MNASRDLIRGFLDSEDVVYTIDPDGTFRFMTELDRGCRIRSCATLLRCEKKRLLVTFELPLRIPRRECESVEWRIARINSRLREYECFETDLIDGIVRFRLTANPPEDIPAVYLDDVYSQLYGMLEYCLDIVELHVNDIVQIIFGDSMPRPAEPHSDPEIDELLSDDVPARKERPLIRLLQALGLVEIDA